MITEKSQNSFANKTVPGLDIRKIREDFPILDTRVGNHILVYLDNAATTQKPQTVIDALVHYYSAQNANIHRGVHYLSEQATDAYEKSRCKIAQFLNASKPREIIFVRGATEAINLVAATFGRKNIGKGDEILLTTMEHHANIVPWQILAEQTGAVIRVTPINERGELQLDAFEQQLSERTKLVSICHISNSLGTINPVHTIIGKAHERGIPVLLDGAQSASHMKIDVQELDCDFFVFSGHKVFGPTGIGVLYGKERLLETLPPYQGGGDMIEKVSFQKTTFKSIPERFEAGTPNISGAIALAAATDYCQKIGRASIAAYKKELLDYATATLSEIKGLTIIGTAREKAGVISFSLEGVHPHDIGTILNSDGIAIRSGHHCTQPLMQHLGIPGTARASFAFYNTREEADKLALALHKVYKLFH